jgi:hypothetical protein
VQVVFGGLASGEEEPAGRSGAVAGNRDHAGSPSAAVSETGHRCLGRLAR